MWAACLSLTVKQAGFIWPPRKLCRGLMELGGFNNPCLTQKAKARNLKVERRCEGTYKCGWAGTILGRMVACGARNPTRKGQKGLAQGHVFSSFEELQGKNQFGREGRAG